MDERARLLPGVEGVNAPLYLWFLNYGLCWVSLSNPLLWSLGGKIIRNIVFVKKNIKYRIFFMKTLGQRLLYSIKKSGLTQKHVANVLNIPETTLSGIVNDRADPGCYKIKQVADYLGVDLHWLLTGKDYVKDVYANNFSTDISGNNVKTGHINISGDNNIIHERRSDYRGEMMGELIHKCQQLSLEHRVSVSKVIDTYLDIQKKMEESEK